MPTLAPSHSKRKESNWNNHHKGRTTTQRGYGAKWRKTRASILRRDKGLCQPCLKQGKYTRATEVDHIVEKAVGGADSLDNLQAICSTCHKRKTGRAGLQAR